MSATATWSALGTRERIVAAATELFAEHGYHGTGVADILAHAAVSRGSFYHFFAVKEELLAEISRVPVEQACRVADAIVAGTEPAAQRLRALAEALLSDIVTHRSAWLVYLREAAQLGADRHEPVIAARRRFEDAWAGLLAEGYAAGELRQVDGVQLKGILGMLNYAVFWIRGEEDRPVRSVSDRFVDLLLDGLRA